MRNNTNIIKLMLRKYYLILTLSKEKLLHYYLLNFDILCLSEFNKVIANHIIFSSFSFCQGSAGEKGDQGPVGPEGPAGEKGDKGDKGEDGKTYQAVIINNYDVKGGTITPDKYFIEPGESVTLTFEYDTVSETSSELNDLIVNLEIKSEKVEIDPEAKEYVIKSTAADMGFQVTGALFSTATTYGQTQIKSYYEDLAKKDNQLPLSKDKDNKLVWAQDSEGKDVHKGYWADKEGTLLTLANTKIAGVETEIAKLKDKTAKEKLDKTNELVKEAKKAIDEAYALMISNAKKDAVVKTEALQNAVTSTNFTKEDRTSLITSQKAAIEEATTLAALTKLVDNTTPGSFDKLYDLKTSSFTLIEGALSKVIALEAGLDSNNKSENKKLKDGLAVWGLTLEGTPSEVAKTYLSQVSAASELEVFGEDSQYAGYPVIGLTGSVAVLNSLEGLKETIYNTIVDSYRTEITESEELQYADVKERLKAKVVSVADNWLDDRKDGTVSTETRNDQLANFYGLGEGSLVAEIEKTLNTEAPSLQKERLYNAKVEYVAAIKESLDKVLAADTVYADAASYSWTKEENAKPTGIKTNVLGYDATNHLDNFLFTGLTSTSSPDTGKTTYTATAPVATYNAQTVYENLVSSTSLDALISVQAVKDAQANNISDCQDAYEKAVGHLGDTILSSKVNFTELPFIGTSDFEKAFRKSYRKDGKVNGDITGTFQNVYDAYKAANASKNTLKTLSDGLVAWVKAEETNLEYKNSKANDASFATWAGIATGTDPNWASNLTDAKKYSEFYKAVSTKIADVIAGKSSEADVKSFVSCTNLNSLYDSDVVVYKNAARTSLENYVSSIVDDLGIAQGLNANAAKELRLNIMGNYYNPNNGKVITKDEYDALSDSKKAPYVSYLCDTFHNVDTWTGQAKVEIKKAISGKSGTADQTGLDNPFTINPTDWENFTITSNPTKDFIETPVLVLLEGIPSSDVAEIEYLEITTSNPTGEWKPLVTNYFGPLDTGFPYKVATSSFRVKFKKAYTGTLTLKIVDASNHDVVIDTFSFDFKTKAE